MLLLLIRHADAGTRDPAQWPDDRARPLSDKGRTVQGGVGRFLRKRNLVPTLVFTSPWTRAMQTAEILRFGSLSRNSHSRGRSATMESLQLAIRELSKRYSDGTLALNRVSLTAPQGMFGLLGPNGAGKSTLMRTLAGLQEADAGEVRLGAIDVLRQAEEVRRALGYLPQEFGFYPQAPALDLLDHFAVLKGVRRRAERHALVAALLKRTNLWEVRHKRLGSFSGGMRQRFGIAVALIGEPRLIIVDEPTAGLDPEERVRFLNLLAELGENAVVILSTHIVDDVAELCSRMAIIGRGQIQFEGDPLGAIAALQGRVWRRFVAADEFERMQREYDVLTTKMVAGRLVARIKAPASPGAGFEPAEPTLEDVYFDTLRTDRGAATIDTAA